MKMDDSWHSWFSGFVDGEGCFTVSSYGSREQGFTVLPHFIIVCRADDVDVLKIMEKVFGGRIYYREPGENQLKRIPNTKPSYRWNVNTKRGYGYWWNILISSHCEAKRKGIMKFGAKR